MSKDRDALPQITRSCLFLRRLPRGVRAWATFEPLTDEQREKLIRLAQTTSPDSNRARG